MSRVFAALLAPGSLSGRPAGWALTITRWVSGVVFVTFGAGKFVNHASETSSFEAYGLPSPGLFADAIGAVELVGGALLLAGLATRPVALVLAADMIGAIVVSGVLRGETISLTLAPILLIAMAALAVLGPGRLSLDARRALKRAVGGLALVSAVGLLGCGSAAPSQNNATARPTTAPAAPAPAAASGAATATRAAIPSSRPGATVKLGTTQYGSVLVDGKGRALYLFTSDRTSRSRCYGACAGNWPPFLTGGKPLAGGAARASLLGITRRSDGSTQVTYRGHPLYYYIGDRRPGQVLCQDVEEFGGRWYVVTRRGSAVL